MTREELLDSSNRREYRNNGVDYVSETISLYDLKKFLESNVCIPKGTNRHPFADVLHEWIEGAECEWAYSLSNSKEWYQDMHISADNNGKKYRIKPSEQVWEYQFVYIKADNTAELAQFYTDEEAKDCHQWIKLEKTKRERKL